MKIPSGVRREAKPWLAFGWLVHRIGYEIIPLWVPSAALSGQ